MDGGPVAADGGDSRQYVIVRLNATADGRAVFRSYSISGAPSTERYRISVKKELNGFAGNYLHERVRWATLSMSARRVAASFCNRESGRWLLLSAGIGATPVLAMLHALASTHSGRPVLWLHAARDGSHHPFAAEARGLVQTLAHGRSYVCYSHPLRATEWK